MSRISVKGIFSMNVFKIIEGKKHLIETYLDNNLVVNLGRYSLCRLLSNNAPGDYFIDQIAFGEGNVAPTTNDVTLQSLPNPYYIKPIIDYTESGLTTIIFNWELLTHEANGLMISEYGLYSHGEILFARKIRSVIEKKVNVILEGYWKIIFI